MTENGRQEDTPSGIIRRDTGRPIQEPSFPSPAAVRAILRLRAVRDLPAPIMAFGIRSVHVDR